MVLIIQAARRINRMWKTKMMVENQKHQLLKWTKKVTAFVRKLTCGRMIRGVSTQVLTQTQMMNVSVKSTWKSNH
jgi:hypothetical protein